MSLKLKGKELSIVFKEIQDFLNTNNLEVEKTDFDRPWGGFFVIKESQTKEFINLFFAELDSNEMVEGQKLSPKILVVAPGKRLSWQYHHRRSEVWKLVSGESGIIKSDTDQQNEVEKMEFNKLVTLACGQRHRLVGLESFGVVAEIWQHTDNDNPSDEEDIVRVDDDFGR